MLGSRFLLPVTKEVTLNTVYICSSLQSRSVICFNAIHASSFSRRLLFHKNVLFTGSQACCLLTTITTFFHITFHFYTHAALGCLEYKVSYLANGFIILSAPEINARKRFMSSMVLAFWVVNSFRFLSLTQISLQVFYYSGENEGKSFSLLNF